MGTGFSKKKKEAKLFQQQMQQFQSQLKDTEVVGVAGSDLVRVTLNGEGDLRQIKIKPECVDPEDVEGLEVLIKAAFEDGQKKLKDKAPSMPNISGFPGF